MQGICAYGCIGFLLSSTWIFCKSRGSKRWWKHGLSLPVSVMRKICRWYPIDLDDFPNERATSMAGYGGFPSWPSLIRGEKLFFGSGDFSHRHTRRRHLWLAGWLSEEKSQARPGGPRGPKGPCHQGSPGENRLEPVGSDKVVASIEPKRHIWRKKRSQADVGIYIYNVFFGLVFWVGLKCKESLENIIRDTCLSNICDARNHCSCGFWDVLGIPS